VNGPIPRVTLLTSYMEYNNSIGPLTVVNLSRRHRLYTDALHWIASAWFPFAAHSRINILDSWPYAVVTHEIKIISKLFQPSSASIWNNFIFARVFVWNYFKITAEDYCSSRIFSNTGQHVQCRWNNFEIISELFQRLK